MSTSVLVVVLLDNEKARIFRVLLGEIEALADLWDYVPDHQRQGGYAQANIQRDHDERVHAHVRHIVDAMTRITEREGSIGSSWAARPK